MQTQTWNLLIDFIKMRLGSPINQIELSDDDIQTYLVNHLMPEISQFISDKKWVYISSDNLQTNADEPILNRAYTIPLDEDNVEIVEVRNIYWNLDWGVGMTANSVVPINPIEYAMMNEMIDIAKYMMPVDTYEFKRPSTIIFDDSLALDTSGTVIAELRITHEDLSTIPSDVYHEIVKPMALGQVMLLISSLRSKYENLTTPFGQINLNWQDLQQRGETLLQQVADKLDMMPPDTFLHIF